VATIRQCATIRDILEHFFFHVIAKVFGGTVAQGVFLAYKCWYKRIIGVPERFFLVAQVAQVVGIASLFKHWSKYAVAQFQSWYSARATLFVFLKTFFALKSPLYAKTGYDS
tara:strand:- start:264 stop:599 length:336 start_codon:yes stop_codon:yes gene_type:complete